ncbi:C4-dicarboxylate ABC transporter substrate-binding protein [Acuticoccus sediminis]|uniref:C4-dicarboxylate ABC transporter substrate-binding protein n=1 Tax=Acuticoccus sediminis TaxID=2184697 RepID=A0A8B2NTL6_9HYPH|nr:DctP family TRAP transporter solute-binding subunit [Acuticoccus sediminis]RAI01849.1 C4-dicarboxylate ABC transporter substrate-binding protein [Acuticoccus sediminis]
MIARSLLAAALVLAGPATAALAQDMTLNLGFVGGPQAPEAIAMGQLAEEIEDKTGGRIAIRLQGGGALGGDREVIEGLQLGTVDMTVSSTSIVANFVPELKIFDIPFLFRDFDHAEAVLDGPTGGAILEDMPDKGLVGLAFGGMGFRELTNSVKPVKTVEDVKGLKIRTQQNEMHIKVWDALGVLPTPMAIPEVYTALQQGVVDGQENPIGAIVNNRFGEVQKYVSLTDHAFTPLVVLISPMVWDQLSDEDKAIFKEAAVHAMERNRAEVEKAIASGLDTLRSQGMTVVDDVDKASFQESLGPVFDSFAEEFGADRIAEIRGVE